MHIGMTGTRNGMTEAQKDCFADLLGSLYNVTHHHHGDCVGADAESHDIAEQCGVECIIHPPVKTELRAYKLSTDVKTPKGYFERNRDIVNESQLLVGFPATMFETKGGTWYTINYGKKQGKPVYIVYPDGSIEKFNVRMEAQ